MSARAWPVMPGAPGLGHTTSKGWHPGAVDGCVKCELLTPPAPPPRRRARIIDPAGERPGATTHDVDARAADDQEDQ